MIKEEEHAAAGEEPKKDELADPTGDRRHRCVQNVYRAFHAFRASSLHVSPASCVNTRLVCKGFCTFRALSLRMSLVTAYMSRTFSTAAEPDYADEGV